MTMVSNKDNELTYECGAGVAFVKNVILLGVPDAVINNEKKIDISKSTIAVITINGTEQGPKKCQQLSLRIKAS